MATNRPVTPISISTEPAPASAPAEGMSQKQRQMLAVGGLVLCLIIGAGIVYWLLFGTSPSQRQVKVDPQQQTGDMNNRAQVRFTPRRPPQLITKEDDTTWRANGTSSSMIVKQRNGGGFDFTLRNTSGGFLNPDQAKLVSGFIRARNDQAMATEWGITADQMTQLKNIHLGGGKAALTSSENSELEGLWKTYNGAADGSAKSDAEKAVIKRMDELAKSHLEESRKAFADKLEEIKKVLTAEQLKKLSQ